MSNLLKSNFVAFSQDNTLVIDANQNKIIRAIDDANDDALAKQISIEEALAEALIMEAELEDSDFDDENLLTMNIDELSDCQDKENGERLKAESIIQNARKEAESIKSEAYDEAERLRADAYEEAEQIKLQAKEEGYRIGYDEACKAAQFELDEKKNLLEQQIRDCEDKLQSEENRLVEETECRMVDLLCQLIPSITGVVIDNQKNVLLYMINMAMRDLDNSKHFVIKVSCDDYEELIEQREEIYGALNPSIELEIFEDAKLSSMQCQIETDNGIVDVSLDTQIDNLVKALKLMVKE